MATQTANRNLHTAKNAKKDEFYTQLTDIENELKHYRHHFKNKAVYCNCDDPRMSKFFHYFSYNFEDLGLKKLITTCYQNLIFYKTYTPEAFPTYDNYGAINVDKTKEIPMDYQGAMGVPIAFLDKYNPEQFEIIKFRKGNDYRDLSVNGKCPFFRILIKNKRL